MGLAFSTSPSTAPVADCRDDAAPQRPRSRRALLVDDDPMMLAFLGMTLERAGWTTHAAETVAQARTWLESDPSITVIVSDIQMPAESGLDLASWLSTNNHDERQAELILITGDTNREALIAALRYRVFDFLHKPFDVGSLLAATDRADLSARARRDRYQRLHALDSALQRVHEERSEFKDRLQQAEARFADSSARLAYVNQTMANIVSHELRTPLIPIIGLAEVLETSTGLTGDEVRDFAAEIRRAGESLAGIVENALNYIDIDRQLRAHPHETIDLGDLARDLMAELTPLMQARAVSITLASAAGAATRAPRWLLRGAFLALLDNALRASPPGGTVIMGQRPGPDAGAIVDIRDQGPGLPERVRRNFGAPFLNGDNTDTRTWPGIGLGIASALRIIEGLGGRLTMQPAQSGTHLRVALPR